MNKLKRIIPLIAVILVGSTMAVGTVIEVLKWTRLDSNPATTEQDDIAVTGLGLFTLAFDTDIPHGSPGYVNYLTWYYVVLEIEADSGVAGEWDLYIEIVIQTDDPAGMQDANDMGTEWANGDGLAGVLSYSNLGMTSTDWAPYDGGMNPLPSPHTNGFKTDFGQSDAGLSSMVAGDIEYITFRFWINDQAVAPGATPGNLFRLSFRLMGESV
ncbi:MAG: hypothetical protein JSW11_01205 [Candidatus Heimdallarchaeota archaeon]|nr:MAG: hypothetical protein JSW11_01205 [Candidatus Heimdallarchaeota archaeon]